jgi:hypothetical protein
MTETTTENVSAVLAVLNQLGVLPCMTLVPCLDVDVFQDHYVTQIHTLGNDFKLVLFIFMNCIK